MCSDAHSITWSYTSTVFPAIQDHFGSVIKPWIVSVKDKMNIKDNMFGLVHPWPKTNVSCKPNSEFHNCFIKDYSITMLNKYINVMYIPDSFYLHQLWSRVRRAPAGDSLPGQQYEEVTSHAGKEPKLKNLKSTCRKGITHR